MYHARGARHMVVIADKMRGVDALKLEEELQRRCMSREKLILRKKYHPEHQSPMTSSGGGR